jgi:hypothetical protein
MDVALGGPEGLQWDLRGVSQRGSEGEDCTFFLLPYIIVLD